MEALRTDYEGVFGELFEEALGLRAVHVEVECVCGEDERRDGEDRNEGGHYPGY